MEIKASQPNPLIHLANALRGMQEFGNKAEIPYLGGVGDLLMGDAQNTAEKLAYGEKPWSGTGQTWQLDPGVVDLAALSSIPAAMGKAGVKGLSKGLRRKPSPPISRTSRFDQLTDTGQDAVVQGRQRALSEGGGYAGGRPTPVQPPMNTGRRDFLKKMAVGTAGAGAAVAAPKMLATALKTGVPKAAATVAKGTAPAVAKGALGALTKGAASKHIVMDMMSDMLSNFSYANMTRKQFGKVLDENPQIAGNMEKELKEWGIDSLEGATEGIGQRINMVVPENATNMTGLVKGSKEQAKAASDLLHKLEPEVFTKWKVTGQWPKKHEKTLRYLDMEDFAEGSYDMPTTEKLFYDLYDDAFITKGRASGEVPPAGTHIIPKKYYNDPGMKEVK